MRLKRHKYRKPCVCFQINIYLNVFLFDCITVWRCFVTGASEVLIRYTSNLKLPRLLSSVWWRLLDCRVNSVILLPLVTVTLPPITYVIGWNKIQSTQNKWKKKKKKKKNRKKNRKKKNQMWKLNEWNKYNLSSIFFFFSQAICDSQIHTNNNYWITNKLL